MKKFVLWVVLFLFVGPAFTYAHDDDQKTPDQVVELISKACAERVQDLLDTGVTAKMRSGSVKQGECLMEQIEKYSEDFFKDAAQRKQLLDRIQQLRKTNFDISDTIHQSNIACNSHCGTMDSLSAYGYDLDMLEDILQRLIYARYQHRNDIKGFDWDLK